MKFFLFVNKYIAFISIIILCKCNIIFIYKFCYQKNIANFYLIIVFLFFFCIYNLKKWKTKINSNISNYIKKPYTFDITIIIKVKYNFIKLMLKVVCLTGDDKGSSSLCYGNDDHSKWMQYRKQIVGDRSIHTIHKSCNESREH